MDAGGQQQQQQQGDVVLPFGLSDVVLYTLSAFAAGIVIRHMLSMLLPKKMAKKDVKVN